MSFPININQLISGKAIEWDRLEFKRAWNPEEIIRSVCAFANDINNWGGGYIVVGISEKEGIPELPPVGLSQNKIDKIQKELVNLCHQIEPFPQIISEPVEFQGQYIFIIWIPGGNERPYKAPATLGVKGQKRFFIRQGSVSKIANQTEEKQLLSLSENIPFDDRLNYNAELSDLSPLLIKAFLQEIKSDLAQEADKIPYRRVGDFLKELEYTEGRSTGFPKIHRHLKRNYSPEPEFETDENNLHFLTTIYSHKLFAPKKVELNEKGKKILDFCRQPKSSHEVLDYIGVSYHSRNITKYVSSLIDGGFLYYMIPDIPFHKNQKYFTIEDKKVSGVVSGIISALDN